MHKRPRGTQSPPSAGSPGPSWFGPDTQAARTHARHQGETTVPADLSGDPLPQADTAGRAASSATTYFFRVHRAFLTARVALSLMLVALVLSAATLNFRPPPWVLPMAVAYALLAALAWWQPSQRKAPSPSQATLRPRQALASIGVDLVFFTVLHHLLGSTVNSQALLVLPVLMAAVMMSRLMALGAAATATVNMLAAAWLQAQEGGSLTQMMTQAGLAGMGLFLVAVLANGLAMRLSREERSARGSLELARQQAELNRLVIDEMSEGVMVVDRRGQVRAANPAARRLLSASGTFGPPPFPLKGVPAWSPLVKAVDHALKHPLQAEGGQELSLRFDDQSQRDLRLRVRFTQGRAPVAEGRTREEMCVMLLEDLRTVRARQRQDKLAAMGRMSAGIAHEIRNPLAAIAQANALLAEDALSPAQQRLVRMVSDNVARLKHIVDDVLAVAPGVRPPAPAIDAIENVVAICNGWRSTHGLSTGDDSLMDLDTSACQAAPTYPHLRVRFEPEHLQRVLVNLLDNALRHQSGQPGSIHVGLRWLPAVHAQGLLMVSVASDGPPITPDTERALFEPFFSTSSRGTGLGLYISRELCERHGASIDYRQHPPQLRHRNEFYVTLPVEPAVTSATAP